MKCNSKKREKLFVFRKILEEIQEKNEFKGVSLWVTPEGEKIETNSLSHKEYVVKNPEDFGLEDVTENNVNEKIKKLYKNGWLRANMIRGKEVTIDGTKESIKDKMSLFYNKAPQYVINIRDGMTGDIEDTRTYGAFDIAQGDFLSGKNGSESMPPWK